MRMLYPILRIRAPCADSSDIYVKSTAPTDIFH